MSRVNVTVNDEVINVLVTVSPEEAAKAFALQAEAAAAAADVSEFNAAASASAALASEQAAELAEDNAAASASTAATKAGEAATSATAAASSASNAASQVGLATDQADRAEGEADRAQSEADTAETKASEAAASATAANGFANMASEKAGEAAASASAALTSQNAAASSASTATTQAGIATTQANNAAASAAAALQSELDAQAAATTITNQVTFAGAQNGDLLLRQAGVFSRINQTEFLRSKVPFLNSSVLEPLVFAWDNFNRPAGAIGQAPSGQNWQTLDPSHGEYTLIQSNVSDECLARPANPSGVHSMVIDRNFFQYSSITSSFAGSVGVKVSGFYGASSARLIIAKDALNSFGVDFFAGTLRVFKIIAGVQTQILSVFISAPSLNQYCSIDFKLLRSSPSSMSLYIDHLYDTQKVRRIDVSSDISVFGSNDLRYVGVVSDSSNPQTTLLIKEFKAYQLG